MMLRETRVRIQLALLVASLALLLTNVGTAIYRVQRKHLHDLPPYTLHCWLFLQFTIGCAALLAAFCLFQEACCTTPSHTRHWPPASTFIDSSPECCRGTGFATWWINTSNDGFESKKPAESGLDWLFQDHSSDGNRDRLVRDLILRHTGAWDCNDLLQDPPPELKDFEMDD